MDDRKILIHLVVNVSDVHDKVDVVAKVISQDSPDDVLSKIVPVPRGSVHENALGYFEFTATGFLSRVDDSPSMPHMR